MFGDLAARIDTLETRLSDLEKVISGARAEQVEILSQLDEYRVFLTDGDRGMEDWVASRLDVSRQTAHRLMTLAHSDDRWILGRFRSGRLGLDRASHLVKLAATGAPTDLLIQAADDYSLGRLWGLIEARREVTAAHEQFSFEARYLVIQPSLDESSFRLWGQLYGLDGQTIDRALRQRADQFPQIPDQTQGQMLADALTSVCADSLTGGSDEDPGRAVTVAEVFVDAALAAPTFGEAGVTTSSGLRVGPATLAEILCGGRIRVVYTDRDRGPVAVTHQTEAIPPAIRAWILHRDQGTCSIEGCRSRNRLQIHHIHQQHHGGDHNPQNLTLLCWYHHHVAIHMLGMTIDPNTPTHRRRLIGQGSLLGRAPPIT